VSYGRPTLAASPALAFWFVLFWLVVHRTVGHRLHDLRSADDSRERRWTTYLLVVIALTLGTVCFVVGWNGRSVPLPVAAAGQILVAAGVAIVASARRTLGKHFSIHLQVDREHVLITDGPYRWVRHPLYTGDLLFYVGLPLLCGAWEALVLPVLLLALVVTRSRTEERMLGEAYPEYAAYRDRTSALIPGIY
jgi:protein-S-isoprenylcysteine O-methyltransferase Ste14